MKPINVAEYKDAGLSRAGSVWDSLKISAAKYQTKPINEENEEEGPADHKSDQDAAQDGDQRTIDGNNMESLNEGCNYFGDCIFQAGKDGEKGKWVQDGDG